jgi:hypothetical protein
MISLVPTQPTTIRAITEIAQYVQSLHKIMHGGNQVKQAAEPCRGPIFEAPRT